MCFTALIFLMINFFQIINCPFGGECVNDQTIAVHGLGGSLLTDFFIILSGMEVPEAVEISCIAEYCKSLDGGMPELGHGVESAADSF